MTNCRSNSADRMRFSSPLAPTEPGACEPIRAAPLSPPTTGARAADARTSFMPVVSALAARPVVADALGYHHVTTTKLAAAWIRYVTAPRFRSPAGCIDHPRQLNTRPHQSGDPRVGGSGCSGGLLEQAGERAWTRGGRLSEGGAGQRDSHPTHGCWVDKAHRIWILNIMLGRYAHLCMLSLYKPITTNHLPTSTQDSNNHQQLRGESLDFERALKPSVKA